MHLLVVPVIIVLNKTARNEPGTTVVVHRPLSTLRELAVTISVCLCFPHSFTLHLLFCPGRNSCIFIKSNIPAFSSERLDRLPCFRVPLIEPFLGSSGVTALPCSASWSLPYSWVLTAPSVCACASPSWHCFLSSGLNLGEPGRERWGRGEVCRAGLGSPGLLPESSLVPCTLTEGLPCAGGVPALGTQQ